MARMTGRVESNKL